MNRVEVIANGGLAVDSNGKIMCVGASDHIEQLTHDYTFEREVDATGKCVLPGFVDCHTHPVFSGDRSHEFAMKINGATYLEVMKAGGGIGFTTSHTKATTEAEHCALLKARMDRMLAQGTTTIEGKSGYGLETDTECKQLRVLHEVAKTHPIEVVSTFLGGHAVPKGQTSTEQTRIIIEEMLPAVMKEREQGKNAVENIDVFCETDVFSVDETRRILLAGKERGLEINFHGDELSPIRAAELAGEVGALAVSHLEHISDQGIVAMKKRPSFAVLLPATVYVLRINPPPARKIIQGGVPVALASDFCPNAHSMSMPFVMNLACIIMRMTLNEALVAATINAAASINRSHLIGSLEKGKQADLVLLDAPLWEHVIYQMVDPPIGEVFKKGRSVWKKR